MESLKLPSRVLLSSTRPGLLVKASKPQEGKRKEESWNLLVVICSSSAALPQWAPRAPACLQVARLLRRAKTNRPKAARRATAFRASSSSLRLLLILLKPKNSTSWSWVPVLRAFRALLPRPKAEPRSLLSKRRARLSLRAIPATPWLRTRLTRQVALRLFRG